MAHVHSMHERGARPRLVCRSMLAPRFSSSLTIARWPQAAAACSRVEAEGRPSAHVVGQSASTSAPLRSHLTTFCSSPRSAAWWISSGRGAGELIAARGRSEPLGHGFGWPHPRACRPSCAPPLPWPSRAAWKPAQSSACNGGSQRTTNPLIQLQFAAQAHGTSERGIGSYCCGDSVCTLLARTLNKVRYDGGRRACAQGSGERCLIERCGRGLPYVCG